jgi:methionine-gamma-lyase
MTKHGFQTRSVHAGESPDPISGASSPNLVMSTTYVADPGVSFSAENNEGDMPYVYTRWGNPTLAQLEMKLADLEGAEAALCFASGMAAITAVLLAHLRKGDRLVMSDVTYAGASELANELLPGMGIEVVRVDMSDLDALDAAITPDTRLVYGETPANPLVRLTDLQAAAQLAHAKGALFAVDSTFASPIATRPIELGADLVIHSLTKYLGGHGDAIGGAVLGPQSIIDTLRSGMLIHAGGILSPFNAWLILRGIATLPLRMQAHQAGALAVARFLEGHPKVERVIYPGLESHPQHELACRQMSNFSGMLTFRVANGARAAHTLAAQLNIFHYAVSLGHHRSLLFYMPTTALLESSFHLTDAQASSYRQYAGDGMFRTSIGIEDGADLCADLDQALSQIAH